MKALIVIISLMILFTFVIILFLFCARYNEKKRGQTKMFTGVQKLTDSTFVLTYHMGDDTRKAYFRAESKYMNDGINAVIMGMNYQCLNDETVKEYKKNIRYVTQISEEEANSG